MQKAMDLKEKTVVGINEIYSNCFDSYKPVIIGFLQYILEHISAASPE